MDNKKNKKKFATPEAEVVSFETEDIITGSAGTDGWGSDNNVEVWG